MIFFFLRAIVICMPAVVAEEAHPQTPALICDFAGGFISKQDLSLRIQIVRVSHLQLVNRDRAFDARQTDETAMTSPESLGEIKFKSYFGLRCQVRSRHLGLHYWMK